MRKAQAPQCTVVPPTCLQVHAGRSGDVFATYQEPDVVRGSSQVKSANMASSSFLKSAISRRLPASSTTDEMPFCASSFASVPPPAPEPIITTTDESLRSNFLGMEPLGLSRPIDIAESAVEITTLCG